MKKRALITGINGMDGSHLADLLLEKNYDVYGLERHVSLPSESFRKNTKHLKGKITFLTGDLTDQNTLSKALIKSQPHEVYNLGAQSFVGESWNIPEKTADINGLGTLRLIEAIRKYSINKNNIKFYQASSSEMFGSSNQKFVNENTPFQPRSPYGVSKLYAYWINKNYRDAFNMFNCSGILFNHESERRSTQFVTRKITDGVARIHLGLSDKLTLGNINSKRDWGYAPDYVEAMWLMMQKDKPEDYVIATGETHSIKDFLDLAFNFIGIKSWEKYVVQDKNLMRPSETDVMKGDSKKALIELGWKPKTSFNQLVELMVSYDINRLTK